MLVSSTEPKLIRQLGRSSTRPERFGVDVLWVARRLTWGVQRKTWEDLVASLADDRLAKEVAQARVLDVRVLVVEGRLAWTSEGQTIIGRREWTRGQMRGLLWSMRAQGWWVEHSDDMMDTYRLVGELGAWSRKERHSSLERRGGGPKGVWGMDATDRQYATWVMQSIPGVGAELAKRIVEKHGLCVQWTVTEEELCQVEGIGKKKAARMLRALGHAGSPGPSLTG